MSTTRTNAHPPRDTHRAGRAGNSAAVRPAPTAGQGRPLGAALLGAVIFTTGIAPLATDMYIPAFPDVARDLGASATGVQLTLTTFFGGMALGQLIGGPFSDARGRRVPLLVATVVLLAASIACALAPSIAFMATARFVQGAAGGWAMVIGRAVIIDLVSGKELVRALNLVQGIGGLLPIVSPLLGGAILQFSHWRMPFWVIAALVVVMFAATLAFVPESLPANRRHGGGLSAFGAGARAVLGNRSYVGYVVVVASAMVGVFAYVASSAFVLRSMGGLSPLGYAVAFAANSAGLTVTTLLAARLAGRVETRAMILVGQCVALVAGAALLVGALWFGTPVALAIGCFLVYLVAMGLVRGNAGALAADAVPEHPGTGSAVLGMLQWGTAGLAAPLAGLGGENSAVPVAVMMTAGMVVSIVGLLRIARLTPQGPQAA